MSPHSRLILMTALAGAWLGAAVAAQAADDRSETARPMIERGAPAQPRSADEEEVAPVPMPIPVMPGGCPFRNNKLELIV